MSESEKIRQFRKILSSSLSSASEDKSPIDKLLTQIDKYDTEKSIEILMKDLWKIFYRNEKHLDKLQSIIQKLLSSSK